MEVLCTKCANKFRLFLKLFVWIGTSKQKFLTQMFVFDPGGYLNKLTSEDGYDSRTNHL